jgi:hypothetical protein
MGKPENPEKNPEKNPRDRGENQQATQFTRSTRAEDRTHGDHCNGTTAVIGERITATPPMLLVLNVRNPSIDQYIPLDIGIIRPSDFLSSPFMIVLISICYYLSHLSVVIIRWILARVIAINP